MSGFLDTASGLPLSPVAHEALVAALQDGWADPTKLYGAAGRARRLLEGAREAVADVLGARPDEVSFTSSGTAAAQLAVLGRLAARPGHVLHSTIEHSCVLSAVAHSGAPATAVAVDRLGGADAAAYVPQPHTTLACLISASHEVGTLQPVEAVAERLGDVPLLVDAAQSVGRTAVPAGWSLLTASAHKWGGPPGVGVLAVRTGVRWRSPLPEAGPYAVGLPQVLAAAVGLQAAVGQAAAEDARLRPLVARIRTEVPLTVPDVEVVGDPDSRLPHLVTLSFPYADGEALTRALDREGFAVSSGSSCSASTLEPSHVLAAMGLLTHGNLRVSLGADTTDADVDRFVAVLPRVLAEQHV
ncbi:cysteine desulfurase family protein [Lapillicoccus sp.]|uniref:cysteine desulfurase family protein n=1 Tax=Lapillicoccus sp. TaxID=1909287 RepID=UPI003982E88E